MQYDQEDARRGPRGATIPPAPASFTRALAHILRSPGASTAELRAEVCAYVATLRAAHVPPERMLVAMKAAMRDVPPPLLEKAIRWCIQGYYAPAAPPRDADATS